MRTDEEVIQAKLKLEQRRAQIIEQSNGFIDWGYIVELYEPTNQINHELKIRGLK